MRAIVAKLCNLLAVCMLAFGSLIQPVSAAQPSAMASPLRTPERVNRTGGPLTAINARGNLIYAGLGSRFAVFDITSPNHPRLVGRSQVLDGDSVRSAVLYGSLAYVMVDTGILYWLDITQPDPSILGSLPAVSTRHLFIFGHYLLAAYENNGEGKIYDIADPYSPKLVNTLADPGAKDIILDGSTAYVLTNSGIQVISYANPAVPQSVGAYSTTWNAMRLARQGNVVAVLSDTKLFLIDFSNTASPKPLNGSGLEMNNSYYMAEMAIAGSRLYVLYGNLEIYDISAPVKSALVRTVSITGLYNYSNEGLIVDQNRVVAAMGPGGLVILDVQNPTLAMTLGRYSENSYTFLNAQGNYLYAFDSGLNLVVMDASQPRSITRRGSLPIGGYVNGLAVSGSYAYVASISWPTSQVKIVNVANPDTLTLISIINTPDNCAPIQRGMVVKSSYLYLACQYDMNYKLVTVNISNPAVPVVSNSTALTFSPSSASVVGNALMLYDYQGKKWMLYSLANPAAPIYSGSYAYSNAANFYGEVSAVGSGTTAYVNSPDGLLVLDIANLSAPKVLGAVSGHGDWTSLVLNGSTIYGGNYGYLTAIDVSNPASPSLVYLDQFTVQNMVFANDALFINNYAGGIDTLGLFDTVQFTLPLYEEGSFTANNRVTYTFQNYSYYQTALLFHRAFMPEFLPALAGMGFAGAGFTLTGVGDTYYPIGGPMKTLTVQVHYTAAETTGLQEETLGLYFWENSHWMKAADSSVNTTSDTVTATSEKMRHWAVLGQKKMGPYSAYLPVTVKNETPNPVDLAIFGMELTQEIQRADNSVPMVANRPTILRVHVAAGPAQAVDDIKLRLTATQNGLPLPGSPVTLGPWAVFSNPDRMQLSQAYNFRLPAEWTVGTVQITAVLDPDNQVLETREDNNYGSISARFWVKPALNLVAVPVNYIHAPTGKMYTGAPTDHLSQYMLEKFPLSAVNGFVHTPVNWSGDLSTQDGWNDLLRVITNLRVSEGAAEATLYYGVLPPTNGEVNYKWGGLGWMGIRASIGYDGAVVHEAGHNYGLPHAPCGVDGDPTFPYPGGFIGQWGLLPSDMSIYEPFGSHDIMSYCSGSIFSDYYYQKLFNADKALGVAVQPEFASQALLVRAVFDAQGNAELQPFYILPDMMVENPANPDMAVELLDASGKVLSTFPVKSMHASEEAPGHDSIKVDAISTLVPLPEQVVARVRLVRNGNVLAERSMTSEPPRVTVSPRAEAAVEGKTITWQPVDEPALVRASLDGGKTWEVLAMDFVGGKLDVPASLAGKQVIYQVLPSETLP